MGSQQFCLKWNNHQSNMLTVFDQLLADESFVDVTIACEGFSLKAHKMVLSACSPYFQKLFVDNPCQHPIVILKDISYDEMKAIIDFMYKGEVNVSQDQLSALLKTAETLKVKGLAEVMSEEVPEKPISQTSRVSTKRPAVESSRSLASSRRKRKPSGSAFRSLLQQPLAASVMASAPSVASPSSCSSVQDDKSENETQNETTATREFVSTTLGKIKDERVETNDVAESEELEAEQIEYSLQEYVTAAITAQSKAISNENDIRVSNVDSLAPGLATGASSSSGGRPSTSAEKKRKERKKTSWTVTDLMQAIDSVRSGKMNVLKAAATFGIPKSSLYDYITGRSGARLKLYNRLQHEPVKPTKVVSLMDDTAALTMPYFSACDVEKDVIVGEESEEMQDEQKLRSNSRPPSSASKKEDTDNTSFSVVCKDLTEMREISDEDIIVVNEETVSATCS